MSAVARLFALVYIARFMKSDDIYHRQGWWWRTMGFTKTHLVGIFITETTLGLLGIAIVACAIIKHPEDMVAWLIVAACVFLLQIGVLLSSILSLLFYMGSRIEKTTEQNYEKADDVA